MDDAAEPGHTTVRRRYGVTRAGAGYRPLREAEGLVMEPRLLIAYSLIVLLIAAAVLLLRRERERRWRRRHPRSIRRR